MNVCFEGIDARIMTFLNNSDTPAAAGVPVCMAADGEVKAAAADSVFIGVCVGGDAAYAAVQTAGVITCPYTGTTAPALGYDKLAAAAGGKVTAKSSGRDYLVLAVDKTAKTVTFVL